MSNRRFRLLTTSRSLARAQAPQRSPRCAENSSTRASSDAPKKLSKSNLSNLRPHWVNVVLYRDHGLRLTGPLVTAWEFTQAWPDGELVVVSGASHSSGDPCMSEAVISAPIDSPYSTNVMAASA